MKIRYFNQCVQGKFPFLYVYQQGLPKRPLGIVDRGCRIVLQGRHQDFNHRGFLEH
jgi:hypothetical protein